MRGCADAAAVKKTRSHCNKGLNSKFTVLKKSPL
jgi:hypothetical protein